MADTATTKLLTLTNILVPAGTMVSFAGKSIPKGWLLCNGANVSRTTYAALFSAIGTTWGAGNGSTTFTLPNCDARFLEGTTTTSNVGSYLAAGLPNITGGGINSECVYQTAVSTGCVRTDLTGSTYNRTWTTVDTGGTCTYRWWTIDAYYSNNLYRSEVSAVQPNSIYTLIIIKVQIAEG